MSQFLKRALFNALLVILVSYPIPGLKLRTVGIKLEVLGADARTLWIIAVVALAMFVWQLFRDHIPLKLGRGVGYKIGGSGLKNFLSLPPTRRWVVLALVVMALVWPFSASRGTVDIAILILIYVILGIDLNIVVSLVGLLDLGHVGFYVVGAYTYALFAEYIGLGFWIALPIAGIIAVLPGLLFGFPVLRLRGDYLAIATPGFGEIIHILLCNMTEITGSPSGIGSIPRPTLFGLTFERRTPEGMQTFHEFFDIAYSTNYKVILLYVAVLLLVLLALLVVNRLMRMLIGRAWEALREDEVACHALGLSPTIIKLPVFTIGASFAGFVDSFFAARQDPVTPRPFTLIESAIIPVIVVLGGAGSQLGVILTVAVMVLLQEMRGLDECRILIFGLTMIVMMIWRPQGLLPIQRPYLELEP